MSKFVDIYLMPIAEEKLAAYKKLANGAGKIFMKHGALSYREYVAAGESEDHGTIGFPNLMKAKPGETVVYAAVEFKSRSHRDKTMKKIFHDPELARMMEGDPLFNYKRMAYGGFSLLVDAK